MTLAPTPFENAAAHTRGNPGPYGAHEASHVNGPAPAQSVASSNGLTPAQPGVISTHSPDSTQMSPILVPPRLADEACAYLTEFMLSPATLEQRPDSGLEVALAHLTDRVLLTLRFGWASA